MMTNFIEYEQMPEDTRGLASLDIALPRSEPDNEASAPVSRADVLRELRLQEPATFALSEDDLNFVRTAVIQAKRYWLWQFAANGKTYFVSVCLRSNGDVCFSYEENYANWTPDQYLIGDYHDFFYDRWRQLYTVRYPPDHPAFKDLPTG
jgi:hypothetical protein